MFECVASWVRRQAQGRKFEAIQVEVTSRCLTRCVMCPRAALADRWCEMDLSWEAFQRIARAFDLAQHVHLQGWGEPLLHPHLFDMIALAKGAGCRVGLTTNGMLLHPDTGKRLLDQDLDLIAISIAGATRHTHESIRVGSDFLVIVENVRRLLGLRARRGTRKPKVEFSYLMTKTNLGELSQAVNLAATLGVDELYAINLDYVIMPGHDQLKAFACSPPLSQEFMRIVADARGRARRAGLTFRPYPLELQEVAVCEANPTKTLFISSDGWVSPCTYLGLAGRTDIPRHFEGRDVTVPRPRFGNILEQDLRDIWNGPAYREFRRQFERRRTGAATRLLDARMVEEGADSRLASPPEPCRTCYKLSGV